MKKNILFASLNFLLNLFKKIKKLIFDRTIWITILSFFTFVTLALIHGYILRNFEISYEKRKLITIGFSLSVIILNLLIVKRWFSLKEVGIQKKGLIRSFIYSFIFVVILRVLDLLDHEKAFPKEFLNWRFFLHLSTFLFLAFQEELMFRGIIFKVWQKSKGFIVALFISTILFGIEHLVYPFLGFEEVTAGIALQTALFAPVFTLIAYRTKNIWGLALSHFLYNISIASSDSLNLKNNPKDSYFFLSVAIYVFFPILIDFVDNKLSKAKQEKINWYKYLSWVFIILFSVLLLIDLIEETDNKKFCPSIENEQVKKCIELTRSPAKDCLGIDLRLDLASKKLKGNQKALQLLKDNCLRLSDVIFHDFTGDSEEELAMITFPTGCDSCRWNRLYIIKNEQVIFERDVEDISFWPVENELGFIIKYPLRRVDEALCCPSEGIVENFTVNSIDGEYDTFYKYDSYCEKY